MIWQLNPCWFSNCYSLFFSHTIIHSTPWPKLNLWQSSYSFWLFVIRRASVGLWRARTLYNSPEKVLSCNMVTNGWRRGLVNHGKEFFYHANIDLKILIKCFFSWICTERQGVLLIENYALFLCLILFPVLV